MMKLFYWNVSCTWHQVCHSHSYHEATPPVAFGVAHQAVEEIGVERETVLVQGCGPIGLLAIGIARALGAGKM